MIPAEDRTALETLLTQMRSFHGELANQQAGICVLHLEAAIAALESHLTRNGVSVIDELRQGLAPAPKASATQVAEQIG